MNSLRLTIITMLLSMTAVTGYAQDEDLKGMWSPVSSVEYGFMPKADLDGKGLEYNQSPYSLMMFFGAKYNIENNLYASGCIGLHLYSSQIKDSQSSSSNLYVSSTNYLTIPLQLGYKIKSSDSDFFVTPYAGLDINYTIGGKNETKYLGETIDKKKIKTGEISLGGKIGAIIGYKNVGLMVSYTLPLGDKQKDNFGEDGYLSIGLTYGF